MLVELGLVQQRYQAVREVLDHGATVVDVARRNGLVRQTVHEWLRRYAAQGHQAPVADHRHLLAGQPHPGLPQPVSAGSLTRLPRTTA